jgi:ADP-ribosylglycohydrolase
MSLQDKFFGCIAASNIASAMGAAVEGRDYWDIEKEFGFLEKLLPYNHYSHRDRMAGTTEDGIERQRLLSTAYIEKRGRISIQDLAKIWLRDINPDNFNKQMEPCDEILYDLLKAGMPAGDVGGYSNYAGIVSFLRSSHPVGLMNAGDPEQAFRDAFEIGSIYQPRHANALDWSSAYCAGIAEACNPEASINSVVEIIRKYLSDEPRREIDEGIEWAEKSNSYEELRDRFYKRYNGRGFVYAMSLSHELMAKGVALFIFTKGNPKNTILDAVNFGRDTDCTAAIASGLSGAFSGSGSLPTEWIDQVDKATIANNFTVSRRTLKETADGLYESFINEANIQKQRYKSFGL